MLINISYVPNAVTPLATQCLNVWSHMADLKCVSFHFAATVYRLDMQLIGLHKVMSLVLDSFIFTVIGLS